MLKVVKLIAISFMVVIRWQWWSNKLWDWMKLCLNETLNLHQKNNCIGTTVLLFFLAMEWQQTNQTHALHLVCIFPTPLTTPLKNLSSSAPQIKNYILLGLSSTASKNPISFSPPRTSISVPKLVNLLSSRNPRRRPSRQLSALPPMGADKRGEIRGWFFGWKSTLLRPHASNDLNTYSGCFRWCLKHVNLCWGLR